MYEIFAELLKRNKIRAADVCRPTGLPSSLFSEWKRRKSTPKVDKLQRIADYFGVTLDYLMTGETRDNETPYYVDDEARQMAEDLSKNPNLHILFDAARTVSKEDLQFVIDMVNRLKKDSE